ncbi:hypothetical protein bplSymb_SCF08301P001 [Bathymodiolus platifrons methanotrophic gill symbiont]|uniref:hypothetical protein n=1 Tax=Bathymodiolus platifrons methanotrophic gill symbiont TaxID=113268 RepID=UPI000B41C8D5|nr:hypothetical protein [Bathymodiolus platifrons methanotrophic gill symbiont]GAW87401.1 hypothetical protein bplSymb_SCF08301P001 [Bathymodiolus platifrons methanotrophic gill symbiont]GFO74259.1 hypothetical protein BPLS_P0823 [Bathymodiolus platifrons methanotrophic gill symbiont]
MCGLIDAYVSEDEYLIDDDFEGSFLIHLFVYYPFGLFGAFLTFMQLQATLNYFDTNITWEFYALIASMIVGYIVGTIVLSVALSAGITYLFFYGLYHLVQYVI